MGRADVKSQVPPSVWGDLTSLDLCVITCNMGQYFPLNEKMHRECN